MKKHNCIQICGIIVLLMVGGCTSAHIPVYLQDKNPYTRRFYASYDEALAATTQALEELGWEIEKETDPTVYEQQRKSDLDEKQILIFTKIRQTPLFIGTRYAKMNIFLRSQKKITEIEIRYLTVSSFLIKNIKSYKNDSAVQRILKHIIKLSEQ